MLACVVVSELYQCADCVVVSELYQCIDMYFRREREHFIVWLVSELYQCVDVR